MRDSAWAGMGGRYDLTMINYEIQQREKAIAINTQRLLTEETNPKLDLPASILWQSELLADLYATKQMMEKANERTNIS